jgi:hypothetical protein
MNDALKDFILLPFSNIISQDLCISPIKQLHWLAFETPQNDVDVTFL